MIVLQEVFCLFCESTYKSTQKNIERTINTFTHTYIRFLSVVTAITTDWHDRHGKRDDKKCNSCVHQQKSKCLTHRPTRTLDLYTRCYKQKYEKIFYTKFYHKSTKIFVEIYLS